MSERRSLLPRAIDEPQPGHYLVRLVRNGPIVPARIALEHGLWQASIGLETFPAHVDPARAPQVFEIWIRGEMILPAKYHAEMVRLRGAPSDDPSRRPRIPIDLNKAPSVF